MAGAEVSLQTRQHLRTTRLAGLEPFIHKRAPVRQPNLADAAAGSDRNAIHRPAIIARYFPDPTVQNQGFYIVGGGNDKPFSALAVDEIPDLSFWGSGQGQFFPRYSFIEADRASLFDDSSDVSGRQRVDNITDAALEQYRSAYGPEVTKDDIFHYVYGLLHSPRYRTQFAADLKKMLPRIPQTPGVERFRAFVDAGKALSDLQIGYETLEPYPLTEVFTGLAVEQDDYARYAVKKMKYADKAGAWDKTRIIYNANITLEGIPEDAQRYMLGSARRSTGSLSVTRSRRTRPQASSTTRMTGRASTGSPGTSLTSSGGSWH